MKKNFYIAPVCELEFVGAEDMITTSLTKGVTLDLGVENSPASFSWGSWS